MISGQRKDLPHPIWASQATLILGTTTGKTDHYRHTTENIRKLCEHVVSEWGLDPSEMSAFSTDNCSNMVGEFKKQITSSE